MPSRWLYLKRNKIWKKKISKKKKEKEKRKRTSLPHAVEATHT